MFLSVFDVFKLGLGPSSSHTMGPMTAAADFLDLLRASPAKHAAAAVHVTLYGSLAFTGKGHATDRAVSLGLLGYRPADIEMAEAERRLAELRADKRLSLPGLPVLAFDPANGVLFDFGPPLPGHANGLVITARNAQDAPVLSETYYSIGGGFILTAAQRDVVLPPSSDAADPRLWPLPVRIVGRDVAHGAGQRPVHCRHEARERGCRPFGSRDRRGSRAHLDHDGRLHRAWAVAGRRVARRPARQAPGQAHPRPALGRTGLEPGAAPQRHGVAGRLRDGGQRRERGRRQGRHGPDQRGRGRHPRRDPLLPGPVHRRRSGPRSGLPADGSGHRRH